MKLIYLLPLLFLLSCSKENSPVPVDTEDPQHVSAKVVGQWKLIAETSSPAYDWNGDGTPETDRFAVYSNCEKERIFNFVQGGTGTVTVPCASPTELKWRVSEKSTKLLYAYLVNNLPANGGTKYTDEVNNTIMEATSTTLKLSVVTSPPNRSEKYTITHSYIKL